MRYDGDRLEADLADSRELAVDLSDMDRDKLVWTVLEVRLPL
jgi:hypothetical protein